MARQFTLDDPLKDAVADIDMVVKTSGGVLVRTINRRFGFNQVLVEAAAESRLGLCPKINGIYFYDNSLTATARWVDLVNRANGEKALIDRNTSAVASVALFPGSALDTAAALNSWATADFLYFNFAQPAGGVGVDLVLLNANASVLAGAYSTASGFTTLVTLVDGTAAGGATFGATAATATDNSAVITWTPQQDWVKRRLREIVVDDNAPNDLGYWVRLSVSAVLDATVSVAQFVAMAPQTASATAIRRQRLKAAVEYVFNLDDEVGGLEWIAVAGADTTLDISWFKTRQTQ